MPSPVLWPFRTRRAGASTRAPALWPFRTRRVGAGPSPSPVYADIEQAVVARIVAAGIVAAKPAPLHVPEKAVYPFITYHITGDVLGKNLSGCDGTSTASFEFKCFSDQYGTARRLAESLRLLWPAMVNFNLYGIRLMGAWAEQSSREYDWGDDADDDGAFTAQLDLTIRYRVAIPT